MKTYKYIARDSSGTRKEGVGQAISSTDIVSWLREQGFTPVSINEVTDSVKKNRKISSRKHVKSADLAALCWQLTTMVEGGITVTTALDTISEDIENLQLQEVLQDISGRMKKGEPFAESLSGYPNIFNNLACSIVLAGESSGTLTLALHRLAEYFDGRDKLAKKMKSAMAYPAFVFGFIILIVIFIMAFIVPRFTTIFDQLGGDLPAFTQGFMAFYDMLRFNLHYIIGGVVLTIVSAVLIHSKTKKGHYLFSKMVLKVPLFGKLISQAFFAMFCKTVATLISSGISVLEVFNILSTMTSNDVIKDAITRTKEQIVEGSSISMSLASSGFFPNMVVKMTQVGEESGSLSKVLNRTADYYERKVDTMITTLMALLEPIMIVTVGAIVLVVVLALYLPIFSMSG